MQKYRPECEIYVLGARLLEAGRLRVWGRVGEESLLYGYRVEAGRFCLRESRAGLMPELDACV